MKSNRLMQDKRGVLTNNLLSAMVRGVLSDSGIGSLPCILKLLIT